MCDSLGERMISGGSPAIRLRVIRSWVMLKEPAIVSNKPGGLSFDLVFVKSELENVFIACVMALSCRLLSIPEQSGHRFHVKADSDSIPIRTPIPFESGQ